jgi:hypothetical protein
VDYVDFVDGIISRSPEILKRQHGQTTADMVKRNRLTARESKNLFHSKYKDKISTLNSAIRKRSV